MTDLKEDEDSETLIDFVSGVLDSSILHLIKTGDGQVWAEVPTQEAREMVVFMKALKVEYPFPERRSAAIQTMIDDGELAEALLGPLNVRGYPNTEQRVHADSEVA